MVRVSDPGQTATLHPQSWSLAVVCVGTPKMYLQSGYFPYLNNYFDFHVCLSIRSSVRPSVCLCVRKLAQFPAVVSQNVTKKRCLVCVRSEKNASWVTLTPQLDRYCRSEAEVRIFNFKTKWSEFQRLSQTAPTEAKPRCLYSILKPHGQSSRGQVRLLTPRQS